MPRGEDGAPGDVSSGRRVFLLLRPLHWNILIFLVLLAVYLLTFVRIHSYDAIPFVMMVEKGDVPALFHPHHILYHYLVYLVYHVLGAMGYAGGAMPVHQGISALFGALGIVVFFNLVKRLTADRFAASISSALLAFSYGYWAYSVEAEVYIPCLFFVLLALSYLYRFLERPRLRYVLIIAALNGAAVWFHISAGLLWPSVVFVLFSSRQLPLRKRLRFSVLYSVLLLLLAAAPYAVVACAHVGTSRESILGWLTYNASIGSWGTWSRGGTLFLAMAGFGQTFFGDYLLGLLRAGEFAVTRGVLLGAVPFLAAAVFLVLLLGQLRSAWRRYRLLLVGSLVPFFSYSILIAWWDPDEVEQWIIPSAFFWMTVSLLMSVWLQRSRSRRGFLAKRAACVLIALVFFVTNLVATILPRKDLANDPRYQAAGTIAGVSRENDLIVVPTGKLEQYLPYSFDRPEVLSLHHLLVRYDHDVPAAAAFLRQRVEQTRLEGHSVLVSEEAIELSLGIRGLHGIDRGDVDELWSEYLPQLETCATYRFLSMRRRFGVRVGSREWNVYRMRE